MQTGEVVQITERGRPVALLVPMPEGSALERLEAQRRVRPADRDLLDLGDPLPPTPGLPLPSERLGAARRL